MKPSRTFLVMLSILLAIIIVTMATLMVAFVSSRIQQNEFNRTSTSIAATNQAIPLDYSNTATAKPWTATPTKQPQPVNF